MTQRKTSRVGLPALYAISSLGLLSACSSWRMPPSPVGAFQSTPLASGWVDTGAVSSHSLSAAVMLDIEAVHRAPLVATVCDFASTREQMTRCSTALVTFADGQEHNKDLDPTYQWMVTAGNGISQYTLANSAVPLCTVMNERLTCVVPDTAADEPKRYGRHKISRRSTKTAGNSPKKPNSNAVVLHQGQSVASNAAALPANGNAPQKTVLTKVVNVGATIAQTGANVAATIVAKHAATVVSTKIISAGLLVAHPVAVPVVVGAVIGAAILGLTGIGLAAFFGRKQPRPKNWVSRAFLKGALLGASGGALGGALAHVPFDNMAHHLLKTHAGLRAAAVVVQHAYNYSVHHLFGSAANHATQHAASVATNTVHAAVAPQGAIHATTTVPAHAAPVPHPAPIHTAAPAPVHTASSLPLPPPVNPDPSTLLTADQMKSLPSYVQHLANSANPADWVKFCKEASFHLVNDNPHHPNAALADKLIEKGISIYNSNPAIHTSAITNTFKHLVRDHAVLARDMVKTAFNTIKPAFLPA